MSVYLKDGAVLLDNDKVATSENCCCCGRDVTEISTITIVSSVSVVTVCDFGGCFGNAIKEVHLNCSRDCTTVFTRINHADTFTADEFQFKFWFEMVDGACTLKILFWDGSAEWGDIGPAICVRECQVASIITWCPGFENFCALPPRSFNEGCLKVNEGHLEIVINNTGHEITPYAIVNLGIDTVCFSSSPPCATEDSLGFGASSLPEIITSAIPFTYEDVSGIIGTYTVTEDNTTPPVGCSSRNAHFEINLTIA